MESRLESHDAPLLIPATFKFQSYFDSTLLSRAVLKQDPASGIVSSTLQDKHTPGYGVSLHPSSEAPVAIIFKRGGSVSSAAFLLKPGQTVFPFGRSVGDQFVGFSFGLPFGWLGGGQVALLVHRSPRAELDWPGRLVEVVLQRQRMAILLATDDPGNQTVAVRALWPNRFPSLATKRLSSTGGVALQNGTPQIAALPSRTMIRLVLADPTAPLVAPATTRFLMIGTDDFDLDAAGALPATAVATYQDVVWPSFFFAGTGTPLIEQRPVNTYDSGPLVGLGCESKDDAGVVAISLGDGGSPDPLDGAFLDVIRYGRI